MLARFDAAKEQLAELIREVRGKTDPPEYLLGFWRQQATDILSTIYGDLPKTCAYVLNHLAEADRQALLAILQNADRFEPGLRIDPTESADKAYFATLVDRTIARSWFFRGAALLVTTMIGITTALLGWEIHGISELAQDVAQQIKRAEAQLQKTQSDMQKQVEEARSIKANIDAGTTELQKTLLGIEGEVAALIKRFETAKATVEIQQRELNEVRARWTNERAAWDNEVPKLTTYFTTQKTQFEERAGTVLAGLNPLLERGRTSAGAIETLSRDAETIRSRLNAQLTESEGKVRVIAHAAETAESSRVGLEAKVTAATSAAETATASANNLVERLDATRDKVEKGLADSDEKRAKLNAVLASWETSYTEWIAKLEAAKTPVTEASATAITQIQALTKDPDATLDRRRAYADSVVDDIGRHEAAAADLLQDMKNRDDALRKRERETRATLDEVNEALSSLREKLSFVSALTEKIEGRRSEAEAELSALLAERPPLTIATLWQTAQSSLAVTMTLVVSSVAAVLALLALWLSRRGR